MFDIDNVNSLEDLLAELRTVGVDHQAVEAKASRTSLPATVMHSVIAFANTDSGGLLVLGVDENGGAFDIVGVENARSIQDTFTAKCSQLDPPLRVAVYPIAHPNGVVIAARIPPVSHHQRPCHHEGDPYSSAYIRVGDRDDLMTRKEVDDLLANRAGKDYSASPASDTARLEPTLTAAFTARARTVSTRNKALPDDEILHKYGAVTSGGTPTLAGLLAIGYNPEALTAAARISYQVAPTDADPPGTRFRTAKKFEGTVGQILDDALAELRSELRVSAVAGADGNLYDRPEVPAEAVRELLSNALVHRSFAPGQVSSSSQVVVHPDHVIIVSPGSIHVDVDPRDLGHPTTLNTPRNLTLTRICEQLTTPSGGRITEAQASGIRVADRACHAADTAPPIFGSRPARFSAALLRGPLHTVATQQQWAARGVDLTEAQARIAAFAQRLESFLAQDAASDFKQVRLDAKLAARLFEQAEPERTTVDLTILEERGVLLSRRMADRRVWELNRPPEQPPVTAPSRDQSTTSRLRVNRTAQIHSLLAAIDVATDKSIRLHEAITVLDVSRATAHKVITAAVEKGLIEPTSDVVHSPQRGYRLTRSGDETLKRGPG